MNVIKIESLRTIERGGLITVPMPLFLVNMMAVGAIPCKILIAAAADSGPQLDPSVCLIHPSVDCVSCTSGKPRFCKFPMTHLIIRGKNPVLVLAFCD